MLVRPSVRPSTNFVGERTSQAYFGAFGHLGPILRFLGLYFGHFGGSKPGFWPYWAYFGGSGPRFGASGPGCEPFLGLFWGFWAWILAILGLFLGF